MWLGLILILVLSISNANAAIDFQLYTSLDSPQPLSTVVRVTGVVTHDPDTKVWYRFRTVDEANNYNIIRDFGPSDSLDWTTYEHEGVQTIEVTAQNKTTGETATRSVDFQWLPVATNQVVVKPTQHPLVYLYSTPPCDKGSFSLVRFTSIPGQTQQTPAKSCDGVHTMNFLIAGIVQNSDYDMQNSVFDGRKTVSSRRLRYHTARLPENLPIAAKWPKVNASAGGGGFILYAALPPNDQIVKDLDGNLVWYYPSAVSFITRPLPGGRFLGLLELAADQSMQRVVEFDLMGLTLKETNAARVNEQLAAKGKRQIGAFHHEAQLLPNGNILVLASVEQILAGVQGDGPVDIVGDMIIILDPDLNVVWTWDSFDWLDPRRAAVLGEKCSSGSCPQLFLAPAANDWTHGNSVQLGPDGSLLYSARHQDWLIKIDYRNGDGGGRILWRFGKDGDFFMDSPIAAPWFSHQHDAQFSNGDSAQIQLFDNGNTRRATDATANSRGQAIEIDETNRVARLAYNADLGVYSMALGSAQQLSNGNYHFGAGWAVNGVSLHLEVDSVGKIVRSLSLPESAYRSFRISDMYSATQ